MLGRTRVTAAFVTSGAAALTNPSAPTPFRNLRRPILFFPSRKAWLIDADKKFFDRTGVTRGFSSFGFIASDLPPIFDARKQQLRYIIGTGLSPASAESVCSKAIAFSDK